MADKAKHTPLPWRARDAGGQGVRIFPDYGDIRERGKLIGIIGGRDLLTDQANAAFIIQATSSHDALVEACGQALRAMWSSPGEDLDIAEIAEQVEAALKLAKGGE
jgi:hypothetical protein